MSVPLPTFDDVLRFEKDALQLYADAKSGAHPFHALDAGMTNERLLAVIRLIKHHVKEGQTPECLNCGTKAEVAPYSYLCDPCATACPACGTNGSCSCSHGG